MKKGTVKVRVCEFSGEELRDQHYIDLPLIRTHRGYHHDFCNGCSYPIEEFSTGIVGIEKADIQGKMVVDNNFIDTQHPFPHRKINTGRYQMDDEDLKAYPYTKICTDANGAEVVIDEAKVRSNEVSVMSSKNSTTLGSCTIV